MTTAKRIKRIINGDEEGIVRAVIYARTATVNDNQKWTCDNQIMLAKDYISKHPNIHLVDTFVDRGASGKNTFNRPQYCEMMQKLEEGTFDLIIVKDFSRLNRDPLERDKLLTEYNATILTLDDFQIHDFEDDNSMLLHNLIYVIDGLYSRRKSMYGKKPS